MYVKLFDKILDSSIWLEPDPVRIAWITMLAAMDEDGFCGFASAKNLARRANISVEDAQRAVDTFEAPDPDSSDPEFEGRRVERVPGGWLVLNAKKYQEIAKREQLKVQIRERVRKHRAKHSGNANVTQANENVTPLYVDVPAALHESRSKPFASSENRSQPEAVVFQLPLISGEEYGVPQTLFDRYVKAYPAISVMGELNKMLVWLDSNSQHRKTRNGIKRFMNAWLSKAQNSAPVNGGVKPVLKAPAPGQSFAERNSQ